MRKPDKYPAIDPRGPDLYRRIIDAAEQLRRQRRLDQDFGLRLARQREAAARAAIRAMEDAEPVVIFVSKDARADLDLPAAIASQSLQTA